MELLNYYKTRYERAKTENYKSKIWHNARKQLDDQAFIQFNEWVNSFPVPKKPEKPKAKPTATHYFRVDQESYDFLKSINYPMNSEVNRLIIEKANELKAK